MLFIKIDFLLLSIDPHGLSKNYKKWSHPGGTYTSTGADAGAWCVHTARRVGVLTQRTGVGVPTQRAGALTQRAGSEALMQRASTQHAGASGVDAGRGY